MTPSRAKEVLEGMGLKLFDEELLYRPDYPMILIRPNDAYIEKGTLEELQAIALWMQDPESVVNANPEGEK